MQKICVQKLHKEVSTVSSQKSRDLLNLQLKLQMRDSLTAFLQI